MSYGHLSGGFGMSDEIELKLGLAPNDLKRLQRHPLLRSLASGRRLRKAELRSTYFDTPDRALAKMSRKAAMRHRSWMANGGGR